MNFINLKRRIAKKLGMLAENNTDIIDGKVTAIDIGNYINDTIQDIIFPLISDRFPEDFLQTTNPLNTYTVTGTVHANSTGTTLVASSNSFTKAMEGFTVYNLTDDESAVLTTYTDATHFTLDTTIGNTWDGDTFYILGNEYTFGGSLTDSKEIISLAVKYTSTGDKVIMDSKHLVNRKSALADLEYYNTSTPGWYLTALDVGTVQTKGIGLVPYPTNYNGTIEITYTEKPAILSADGDLPFLDNIGISTPIVNNATAMGKRDQGVSFNSSDYEEADPVTKAILPKGTRLVIMSYKPKSRSGNAPVPQDPYYHAMSRRRF